MLSVDQLILYLGSGDVFEDLEKNNDLPGLFLRQASVMIETQLETKANVKKLIYLAHDPFFLPRIQLLYRLSELGLPIVFNTGEVLGYDWAARSPDPDLVFVDYWLRRLYQYGGRINRAKGTIRALRAVFKLIWLDLVELTVEDGSGAIPWDTGTIGGTEIRLDQPKRRWDSGDCYRCIEVSAKISFLAVPGFNPGPYADLAEEMKRQLAYNIYKVFSWGLPIDCKLVGITFEDILVPNPDPLRAFSQGFSFAFS